MNIQTEHLENQIARFTVEIDPQRLETAKQKAARQIAKQVRIPGFRKGKAPYRILVQNGLEPQILNDAIDELSQEIYRETLDQSDIEPYGPGAFEDFTLEPPVFIYTVPLKPIIELNDYADVRVEYEAPEVTDEMVGRALRRLQEQEAEGEEVDTPAAMGNRVTVDIHTEFVDDPPLDEDGEPLGPEKGASFLHEHDAEYVLDSEFDPIIPGFSEAMVGAEAGEDVEFELTVPEEGEEYEQIQGRKVKISLSVSSVEAITLPELDDAFAASVTEDENDPLTMEQLHDRVREAIQNDLEAQAKSEYSSKVLDAMVEQARVEYPEAMVEDQIDMMIEDFGNRISQQGINLETYYQITGTTQDELRDQYRDQAEVILRRGLVLREIVKQNELEVLDEQIDLRINQALQTYGGGAHLRPIFDSDHMRNAMSGDISQSMALDYIVRIGRGEDVSEFMAEMKADAEEQLAEFAAAQEAEEAEAEEGGDDEAETEAEAELEETSDPEAVSEGSDISDEVEVDVEEADARVE